MDSPLACKRIVVTRPIKQADAFCAQLKAAGAVPISFPTIRLEPMPDSTLLHQTLKSLSDYDRVVFTSVNGVKYTWAGLDGAWPANVPTVAIGPATADALRKRGADPEFMPDEYTAEQIAFGLERVAGQNILLLRAQKARPALANILRTRQANITEVPVYQTLMNTPDQSAFDLLQSGFDAVTFTSSSTVEAFAAMCEQPAGHVVVACIGPITARTARNCGYTVDVVAGRYTTSGLIESLEDYYLND